MSASERLQVDRCNRERAYGVPTKSERVPGTVFGVQRNGATDGAGAAWLVLCSFFFVLLPRPPLLPRLYIYFLLLHYTRSELFAISLSYFFCFFLLSCISRTLFFLCLLYVLLYLLSFFSLARSAFASCSSCFTSSRLALILRYIAFLFRIRVASFLFISFSCFAPFVPLDLLSLSFSSNLASTFSISLSPQGLALCHCSKLRILVNVSLFVHLYLFSSFSVQFRKNRLVYTVLQKN